MPQARGEIQKRTARLHPPGLKQCKSSPAIPSLKASCEVRARQREAASAARLVVRSRSGEEQRSENTSGSQRISEWGRCLDRRFAGCAQS